MREITFAFSPVVLTEPNLKGDISLSGANVSQVTTDAVEFAGGDAEGLFAAVAEAAPGGGSLVFSEEPEADGNLLAV